MGWIFQKEWLIQCLKNAIREYTDFLSNSPICHMLMIPSFKNGANSNLTFIPLIFIHPNREIIFVNFFCFLPFQVDSPKRSKRTKQMLVHMPQKDTFLTQLRPFTTVQHFYKLLNRFILVPPTSTIITKTAQKKKFQPKQHIRQFSCLDAVEQRTARHSMFWSLSLHIRCSSQACNQVILHMISSIIICI